EDLIDLLSKYYTGFEKLKVEYVKIGLDENSGLKGTLRKGIKEVEAKGKSLGSVLLIRDLLQLRRNEKDFFLRSDETYVGKFTKNIEVLLSNLEAQAIPDTDKEEIKTLVNNYKRDFEAVVGALKGIGLTHDSGIQKEIRVLVRSIEPKFEKIVEDFKVAVDIKIKVLTYVVYIPIGLLFLIFIFMYRFVNTSILKRVFVMRDYMNELSQSIEDQTKQGDLTRRIRDKENDEIGVLIKDYNQLLDVFQGNFTTIKKAVGLIHTAAENVSVGSDDLNARNNEQAASVTETSTTLDEVSSIVRAGSRSVEVITSDLDSFNTEIESKSGHIDNVTQTMRDIDESGKKIDNIVNVINDISFQTNLLALNAAVEAARAGEAGRGFAVVAAEVRNLAQKTAESSKTIQEIVTSNVESTKKGLQLVNETAEFFNAIVGNIKDILTRLKDNSEGLKEQTIGVDQISQAMANLDTAVNMNATLAEELATNSVGIKVSTDELKAIVSSFKVESGEVNSTTASPKTKSTPAPANRAFKSEPTKRQRAPKKQKAPKKSSTPPKEKKTKKTPEPSADDDFFGVSDDDGFEEF
ncbi:MAG: methyl-accepting chemotaxis protein, partial [bacterium]|nr:methyl-accepting chemotaxis protein [bacterium]